MGQEYSGIFLSTFELKDISTFIKSASCVYFGIHYLLM